MSLSGKELHLVHNDAISSQLRKIVGDTDFDKMTASNYNRVRIKLENLIQLWCLCKLTLKGKVLIVNTLLITQMLYICSVLHPPEWVIKIYPALIRDFIWDRKPTKVKYSLYGQ